MKINRDRIALSAFLVALALLLWLSGALFARFNIFPYPYIARAIQTAKESVTAPNRYHPAVLDFEGTRVARPELYSPGVTLITSYFKEFGWQAGIRILDREGNVLHEWPVDFASILPDRKPFQDYIHGTKLFPNGDVVFNIEFAGIVRMDRCGKILWQNDRFRAHHSISTAHDGSLWVPGNIIRGNDAESRDYLKPYQILHPTLYEDTLVNLSPEGEVLRTFSTIDILYRNNLQRVIAKMGRGKMAETGAEKGFSSDVFHMNDVEELSPEMAPDYPLFEAGDLVVSLRQLHMVFVVDPDDLKVKWYTITSTLSQHDPDFIGNGWIGVFDNNLDFTDRGTLDGGTRVLAIKPDTGEEKVLYPTGSATPIYSDYGGKWQLLDNGNYLITVAREGQALEVTPTGETVWQWVTPRFSATHIPEVLEATRYDISPQTVAGWTCGG